jgi:hypothetical protein
MNDSWEIEGMQGTGGCCGDGCGDNLCAECGAWNKDGLCKYCAMSVEELESSLPLSFQRSEIKQNPCEECKKEMHHTVTYEQEIWRSDSFSSNGSSRQYQISYRPCSWCHSKEIFRTERYRTLREVLTNAHKMLDRMGVKHE